MVWPTRQEAINLTAIVIGVSVAVGVFLGFVDFVFAQGFQLLLR
ncbi:MAG TPA: preprotein translocase subunit SecE [Chloroflexota bacterium]|nr:preprotein translocase subunit SecE [Chloroflexota bacterium]